MIFLAIFLLAAGLLMLWYPTFVWNITERWKSQSAEEPSSLYLLSIRFGGFLCVLIGLAISLVNLFA